MNIAKGYKKIIIGVPGEVANKKDEIYVCINALKKEKWKISPKYKN